MASFYHEVHFDSKLWLTTHVGRVVSSRFDYLQRFKFVRKSHPFEATKSMINAFVVSMIDDRNCLLIGQPFSQFERLQKVLNGAAGQR